MKILKNRTKIQISEGNTKFIWILPNKSIFGAAKDTKKTDAPIKIADYLVRQSVKQPYPPPLPAAAVGRNPPGIHARIDSRR